MTDINEKEITVQVEERLHFTECDRLDVSIHELISEIDSEYQKVLGYDYDECCETVIKIDSFIVKKGDIFCKAKVCQNTGEW